MPRKQGSAVALLPDLPERSTDPGHIQELRRNSRTFTLPIKWIGLLEPAKQPRTEASWGERWRSAPCPAPTPATPSI